MEAERQRASADGQRDLAERAQLVATARTREAESERQKALEHYQEVRALASSILFDLYDGVRDLAGSDTARRLIVAKVQHQLELLNTDSGQDIGLQRDLAASYERMGELRVDARQPDKNDAGAAVESYRHSVELRKQIVSRPAALPRDRRDLALSLAKLGDGQFFASDATQALASYRDARTMAESVRRT